jgi:RNA recognition motif-containing protein
MVTSRTGPPDRPIEYYMHTIFVGDLPENCDQNELGEVFAQYGNIVEFKVIQSKR